VIAEGGTPPAIGAAETVQAIVIAEEMVIAAAIVQAQGPVTVAPNPVVEVGIALGIAVYRPARVAGPKVARLAVLPEAAPARAVRGEPRAGEVRVAVRAAAAEGGDKLMQREFNWITKNAGARLRCFTSGALFLVVGLGMSILPAAAQTSQSSATAHTSAQTKFATPQKAADSLIQAAATYDVAGLQKILGPGSEDLFASEDPVRDKNNTAEFVTMARQKTEISVDPKNPGVANVLVGEDAWPLPIPIVKSGNEWMFDTKAGREEMLTRRIGSNELDAIEICRGYVDAQLEYALEKHDGAETNQYAQRVISTPGKHDGLVWRNSDGTLGGPIAEGIAKALQQGYTDKSQPYHGYFFKILKGQGPAAPLGRMDFVVGGAMIGGFALAAAPAEYRVTGVQTFVVSYEGVVYQKDLGPDTLKRFREMELYNPDKTWRSTEDNW
jgi:hypothetical protein